MKIFIWDDAADSRVCPFLLFQNRTFTYEFDLGPATTTAPKMGLLYVPEWRSSIGRTIQYHFYESDG